MLSTARKRLRTVMEDLWARYVGELSAGLVILWPFHHYRAKTTLFQSTTEAMRAVSWNQPESVKTTGATA